MLASMVLFNIGFYLVVPFLAVHLSEGLGFAAWIVGLVLGLRMASQQGLFFVGGSLADRFGVRRIVLIGIAVRVVGFVAVGFAQSLVGVIVGVLLIGLAAALFAPAVEAANAGYGAVLERRKIMRRTELFGLEQMCSRTGTVLGPLLGAALLGVPFAWTTCSAAVLFAGLWLAFFCWFPASVTTSGADPASVVISDRRLWAVWRSVLSHRVFLAYAALCAAQLSAYSLLYLMLPAELEAIAGSQSALGWFYAAAALMVIVGQRPVIRLVRRIGHQDAVVGGLSLMAVSFLVPAIADGLTDSTAWQYVAVAGWVVLLHVGQMLMVPPMRDTVALLAGEHNLGAHFGMLNSMAGLGCLIASVGVGGLYDLASEAEVATGLVWCAVTAAILGAVAGLTLWYRRHPDIASPIVAV
jgi:MFS family permease